MVSDQVQESPLRVFGFKKSSRSEQSRNCVEVASDGNAVYVRDSKASAGPMLSFGPVAWGAFIAGVKEGVFDRQ